MFDKFVGKPGSVQFVACKGVLKWYGSQMVCNAFVSDSNDRRKKQSREFHGIFTGLLDADVTSMSLLSNFNYQSN